MFRELASKQPEQNMGMYRFSIEKRVAESPVGRKQDGSRMESRTKD